MLDKLINNYILERKTLEEISNKISEVTDLIASKIEDEKRIIFVAVGSSSDITRGLAADLEYNYNINRSNIVICEAGANYRELMNNWREMGALKSTAVFDMQELELTSDDIVIGISSSGLTEYVVGALNYANDINATTVLVTNAEFSELDVKPKYHLNLKYDKTVTNVRALEATTLIKIILDMLIYDSIIKSGRMFKDQLIYQKWNSHRQKEIVVGNLMVATDKEQEQVIEALDKCEWVTHIATMMLLNDLDVEESVKRLKRIKGNFNKIND